MAMDERTFNELTGREETPDAFELLPDAAFGPVTTSLNNALQKYAGGLNHSRVKLSDFNYQFYTRTSPFWGVKYLLCVFQSKTTGRTLKDSEVRLWPRSDFWTIVVELANLG